MVRPLPLSEPDSLNLILSKNLILSEARRAPEALAGHDPLHPPQRNLHEHQHRPGHLPENQ